MPFTPAGARGIIIVGRNTEGVGLIEKNFMSVACGGDDAFAYSAAARAGGGEKEHRL